MRGVFCLVGRRNRAAVRVMLTKLRERYFVEDGCLGSLASQYRQQQRLHDQRIDRKDADQPSPEWSPLQTCLIWSGLHADKRMLLYRVRDGVKFRRVRKSIRAGLTNAPPNRRRQYSRRLRCGNPGRAALVAAPAKRKIGRHGIFYEKDPPRAFKPRVYGSSHRCARLRR